MVRAHNAAHAVRLTNVCGHAASSSAGADLDQPLRQWSTRTVGAFISHTRFGHVLDWLRSEGVELVAMEATSDYWKPLFYQLEAHGFTCWLLNARHVKNVPGRPKTDKLDAVWLAKVVRGGDVSPEPGSSAADSSAA